ncbi:ankyrin repeat-containing protein [Terriglobus roseus DSM 18391]|uniref:Ankyrin repeat-containing protein n=2 Tax=Terriglobus roseus TaxID=392734 RepID=I3ZJ06_TERRK|nr:ankyrin repeat-containing protein [Terriglobus roseus DSM 18391]
MVGILAALLLINSSFLMPDDAHSSYPSISYEVARAHEVKPHRRTIPVDGVRPGFNQLHLTLIVSPTGDVTKADASGSDADLKFWPSLQGEVGQWRFEPFEKNGIPVAVEVEEYIDLVPPERLPKRHVTAPAIRPDSKVIITLERTGCFGSCPSYTVAVSTTGIVFDGRSFVVAEGKHADTADADEVRKLAKRIVETDFYSMDDSYTALVTDNPTNVLAVSIDEHRKQVVDYVGAWEGMPAVITELEERVDTLARTQRWIEGDDGLVQALKAEKFDFQTFAAQTMLKAAAAHGRTATVQQFLQAGVPLKPIPRPKLGKEEPGNSFQPVGLLTSASHHPAALQELINAGASRSDQSDKDLALVGAAQSGNVEAARALIAYGANPNADLKKLTITQEGGGMTMQGSGSGSVLIYAAESGNPAMVREVLQYHPKLETHDREGKTAMFSAGNYRSSDQDGARVECVRLLAEAGANVNARDNDGNTPLHETFLTDVEEELLKLGANVNARNNDGETPIFTTVDNDGIPLFIEHGADLNIRNKKGETVMEAAQSKGPLRQEALRKAMQSASPQKIPAPLKTRNSSRHRSRGHISFRAPLSSLARPCSTKVGFSETGVGTLEAPAFTHERATQRCSLKFEL